MFQGILNILNIQTFRHSDIPGSQLLSDIQTFFWKVPILFAKVSFTPENKFTRFVRIEFTDMTTQKVDTPTTSNCDVSVEEVELTYQRP